MWFLRRACEFFAPARGTLWMSLLRASPPISPAAYDALPTRESSGRWRSLTSSLQIGARGPDQSQHALISKRIGTPDIPRLQRTRGNGERASRAAAARTERAFRALRECFRFHLACRSSGRWSFWRDGRFEPVPLARPAFML